MTSSTTQLRAAAMTPTLAPAGDVGPLARRRHGDDAGAADLDEGLDGAAEIAHEGDRRR